MNYVVYYKDTLEVYRFVNSENVKLTNDLAIARCENIPQGDKFTVTNLQSKTEKYTVKEPIEVVKADEQGNKHVEIEYIEVEKEREYQTCDLVVIPYTETELIKKKARQYENLVERLIRQKYSLSNEFAILRQASTKVEEFNEYNAYAEECKKRAKQEVYGV